MTAGWLALAACADGEGPAPVEDRLERRTRGERAAGGTRGADVAGAGGASGDPGGESGMPAPGAANDGGVALDVYADAGPPANDGALAADAGAQGPSTAAPDGGTAGGIGADAGSQPPPPVDPEPDDDVPTDPSPGDPPTLPDPPSDDQPGDDPPDDDDTDPDLPVPGGDGSEDPDPDEEPWELQPSFHLVVIGSSTAAGEGASSSARSWVSLLGSALAQRGEVSVSNLAVAGYTTSELLPTSLVSGNIDEAIAEKPDLIVVALAGSNDLSLGISTETYVARLGSLRDRARDAGIPTFFTSTAPKDLSSQDRAMLYDWSEAMAASFQSCWVPVQQASYTPCFIDLFAALGSPTLGLLPEYSSGDGIHLNDAGHSAVYRAASPVIEPYVCGVTLCEPGQ